MGMGDALALESQCRAFWAACSLETQWHSGSGSDGGREAPSGRCQARWEGKGREGVGDRLDWEWAEGETRNETRKDNDRTKENLALNPTLNGGGLENLSAVASTIVRFGLRPRHGVGCS